jgi:hypothetical protein
MDTDIVHYKQHIVTVICVELKGHHTSKTLGVLVGDVRRLL